MRKLLAVVSTFLLVACTGGEGPAPSPSTPEASVTPAGPAMNAEQIEQLAAALPQREGKDLKPTRLADDVVPPTNQWFSGLVFGDEDLPVFPMPLSFALQKGGFSVGVPAVVVSEKTIMGSHAPNLTMTFDSEPNFLFTERDVASITLADEKVGSLRLVQGSPSLAFTAAGEQRVTLNEAPTEAGDGVWTVGEGFGLTGSGIDVEGSTVVVPDGATATWFAIPEGGEVAKLAPLAAATISSTSVEYAPGDEKVTTKLAYETGGADTIFAVMPHQQETVKDADCSLGSFDSIWGPLTLCSGQGFSWESPTYPARKSLDISGLADDEAQELREAVKADVAALDAYPADTYFGGKALQRDAQLYTLARDLEMPEAETVKQKVTEQLKMWAEPNGCEEREAFCFVYDETNKGVVGQTPSFGSDEFNDHHFHYGYFLYAAAVMGADDPDLVEELRPVIDVLAADIASDVETDRFPVRRNFDVYASHSWASGNSPFGDGNNQESSSEAVNAWAGLTLWGEVSGNDGLEQQGRWMHALEAQSARAYWTDFDLSEPLYEDFGHKITSLNFSGKRDYATWFSPEPAAMLAILIIPASPSSDHLQGDPERIRTNVAEGLGGQGYDQMYGEFLLMYHALAGDEERQEALKIARDLPRSDLDDGITYSYLLAWLLAAG